MGHTGEKGHRFDAVIFDLGGTLMHFDGSWADAMQKADRELLDGLSNIGFEVPAGDFLAAYRARLDAYYEEREAEFIEHTTMYLLRETLVEFGYLDVEEERLRQALDAAYAVTQDLWQPEQDAALVLSALKDQGYRIGLISNAADHEDVEVLVEKAGIGPYLDAVITSAGFGRRKPDPRIFYAMLEKLGVPAERVVMVGDTLGADVLGARNAGIYSIWIKRRADTPANRAHAETIQPDATIHTLSELLPLLEL